MSSPDKPGAPWSLPVPLPKPPVLAIVSLNSNLKANPCWKMCSVLEEGSQAPGLKPLNGPCRCLVVLIGGHVTLLFLSAHFQYDSRHIKGLLFSLGGTKLENRISKALYFSSEHSEGVHSDPRGQRCCRLAGFPHLFSSDLCHQ